LRCGRTSTSLLADPFGEKETSNHPLEGRHPEAPPPPIGVVSLQLLPSDDACALHGGFLALSTEALDSGFVLTATPGADMTSFLSSMMAARDEPDGLERTATGDGADFLSVDRLLGATLNGLTPLPSPSRASPAASFRGVLSSESRLRQLPSVFRIVIDSATSLPHWIAAHIAAPLTVAIQHLQFEEYMVVVANDEQPAVSANVTASSTKHHGLHAGPSPGFFALVELLDVACLGGELGRLMSAFIDPLTAAPVQWAPAPISTGAAAMLRGLFADVTAGVPFAAHLYLHVKRSSAIEEMRSLPIHLLALSCFRSLRLHFVPHTHASGAFHRDYMAFEASANGTTTEHMTDPRMSAAFSLNVALTFAVRLLEQRWRSNGYKHRHAASRGSASSVVPNGEMALIHALRYSLDAVRRFLLHELQQLTSRFKTKCRDEVKTVSGLRDAYAELSAEVGHLALATQDTRPVYRKVEAIIALSLELCLSPGSASFAALTMGTRVPPLKRLERAVAGVCEAINQSTTMSVRAAPLVMLLTYNDYFDSK
jgi:hypothetical protein